MLLQLAWLYAPNGVWHWNMCSFTDPSESYCYSLLVFPFWALLQCRSNDDAVLLEDVIQDCHWLLTYRSRGRHVRSSQVHKGSTEITAQGSYVFDYGGRTWNVAKLIVEKTNKMTRKEVS